MEMYNMQWEKSIRFVILQKYLNTKEKMMNSNLNGYCIIDYAIPLIITVEYNRC